MFTARVVAVLTGHEPINVNEIPIERRISLLER